LTPTAPDRGEVWLIDFSPTIGREHSGMRRGLIISVDTFNHGPAELIVVIPLTSKRKGIPLHVRISPPEGGLTMDSYAKCEDLRSVSKIRLSRKLGRVNADTVAAVEDRLRILIGL
jgi:mRNA interferase MazF